MMDESSESDDDQKMQSPEKSSGPEFNPKMFYWLFNPILEFSKRKDFDLDADIDPNDFVKMR